jgi:ADP-heptose:LPS heptosyltransferase
MPPNKHHILVIRLSALGDVAMTIPVILTLLSQNKNLKITVLTKPFYSSLFEDIPNLNVIKAKVETKHKGLSGLYNLSNELANHQFTAVADLHDVLRTKVLRFFLFFRGVNLKVIDKGRREKKALTRLKRKKFKQLKTTIQRYLEVFLRLGYEINLNDPQYLQKRELSQNLIEELNYDSDHKHLGIAPFAAHDGKTYPADLMQEVIKNLAENKSLKIYLFGGKDLEMSRLQNWAKPYSNVYCIAGKYDFKTELNLISHLDLMLSMDSGNGHLAAMYGVKVITIWGQTHPYAGFVPFLQTENQQILPDRKIFPLLPTSIYGNKKVVGYDKVMRSVEPEIIIDKVRSFLN